MAGRLFGLWPTKRQWKGWTLPSKLSVIGAYVGITALLLTIVSFILLLSGREANLPSIYRLRVTVLNPQQLPVEDAKVRSSLGGEPKRVAGGWQFDIPAASVPIDKKITIFAERKNALFKGEDNLQLGQDPNPVISIQLAKNMSAKIRGMVQDITGQAIPGVKVSVVGYGATVIKTGVNGDFVLPARTAAGQRIRMHFEAKGYKPKDQYHFAGDSPATIVLESVQQ